MLIISRRIRGPFVTIGSRVQCTRDGWTVLMNMQSGFALNLDLTKMFCSFFRVPPDPTDLLVRMVEPVPMVLLVLPVLVEPQDTSAPL